MVEYPIALALARRFVNQLAGSLEAAKRSRWVEPRMMAPASLGLSLRVESIRDAAE